MKRKGYLYLPKAQVGKFIPSWANPYNWGVEDYSDKTDFNKAYAAAKKAGEEEFIWKGKRFNTKYAGTPRQEVGAYGINGKPINQKDIDKPAQVNLYPAFGIYLPGHISASIGDNQTSVDYSSRGNYPYGIDKVKNKGEKSFNVYGQDNLTFSNKVASLPTGKYMLEDKYTPSDWNLFTNNCADNVCDAFGIPRSKGIETPAGTALKIKEKYPTIDVTGRTYEDYVELLDNINKRNNYRDLSNKEFYEASSNKALKNVDKLISIYYSSDTPADLKKRIGKTIQSSLTTKGFNLTKSTKADGSFDGILGPETIKALKDYNMKNNGSTKKKYGGYLPKAQNMGTWDPNNPVESDMNSYRPKAPRTNIGSGMYAKVNSQFDEDVFGINKPLDSTAFGNQYRDWLDSQTAKNAQRQPQANPMFMSGQNAPMTSAVNNIQGTGTELIFNLVKPQPPYQAPQGDGSMYGGGDGSGDSSAQSQQGVKLDSGTTESGPSFGQKVGAFAKGMWKGANADNILLGTKALNNLLEKTPDYDQFQRNYREPGQSMSRGDWTTNQGFLQPNRLGYFDKFSVGTGSMQFGGEVDMTDDEIYEFLAAGGELEFID